MARPKKSDTMEVLSIRVPKPMIVEIDRVTDRLREETPLLVINRTDTIRYLLARALKELVQGRERRRR